MAPVLALRDVRLGPTAPPLGCFDGVDMAPGGRRGRACLVGAQTARGSRPCCAILGRADLGRRRRAHPAAGDGGSSLVGPGAADRGGHAGRFRRRRWGGAPRGRGGAGGSFGLDPGRPPNRPLPAARRGAPPWPGPSQRQPDVLAAGRSRPTHPRQSLAIEQLEILIGAEPRLGAGSSATTRAFLERVTSRCFWLESRRVRRLDRRPSPSSSRGRRS